MYNVLFYKQNITSLSFLVGATVAIHARLKNYLKGTVKPVLSGHSKIDKIKVLKTNASLMKVESIGTFCNTFDNVS